MPRKSSSSKLTSAANSSVLKAKHPSFSSRNNTSLEETTPLLESSSSARNLSLLDEMDQQNPQYGSNEDLTDPSKPLNPTTTTSLTASSPPLINSNGPDLSQTIANAGSKPLTPVSPTPISTATPQQQLRQNGSTTTGNNSNVMIGSKVPSGFSYHRVGPQRTSYTTQKLKLLPDQPDGVDDEESGREVYSQVTRIKDTPARKDAERLGKAHRSLLPRVTGYCTASSFRMKEITRYLNSRKHYKASPKLFDECLYTPYTYKREGTRSAATSPTRREHNGHSSSNNGKDKDRNSSETGLMRLDDEGGEIDVELTGHSDVFLFEYGVAVFWGFTELEERRFLKELARFENEKLADEDIQVEEFNYYITKSYQPRIYNDFITLRDGSNYMVKLSISHAIAQSVKISLFEELVDNTIEDTQDFPQEVALTGKISMSRKDIMKSIGELFILRINVNLHGSVLDSPELMWSEPHLEPIYQATRGYLEITQRVQLLNQRLEVISDLLQMLKEQMGYAHGEYLEFIVIVLIAVEVLVAIVNVAVDYFASKK